VQCFLPCVLIGELLFAVRLHDCRDANLFHAFFNFAVVPTRVPLPHCHAPANKIIIVSSLLQCLQLIHCQHVRLNLFLWLDRWFKCVSYSASLIVPFCLILTANYVMTATYRMRCTRLACRWRLLNEMIDMPAYLRLNMFLAVYENGPNRHVFSNRILIFKIVDF
jgi:hypothetical protein